jgi:membrane protein implicated in regulation of membrane protease activity
MILFAQETWPFGAALLLMLALFVIEGAGLLLSFSPSHWLDAITPDVPDGVEGALCWLHLGKVPFLILLGIFLAGFSMSGYAIQAFSKALLGNLLPAWLASVPSLFAGVALVSGLGGLIARIMPSDQTTAVSEQSLVGRAGVVTQGVAREGFAAQAKVRDMHGRAHYVMVEPDLASDTFEEGAAVLLVKKIGARYRGIKNPHPELL